MELRYFVKLPDIACAETDATADRLLTRGYKECGRAYYLRIWQLRDDARRAQLAREVATPAPKRPAASVPLGNGWTQFFI